MLGGLRASRQGGSLLAGGFAAPCASNVQKAEKDGQPENMAQRPGFWLRTAPVAGITVDKLTYRL